MSADDLYYAIGTVAVTNNSATVEGSGTLWQVDANHPRLMEGDELVVVGGSDKMPYVILSVDDDDTITLSRPYLGNTASGLSYIIYKNSPFRQETPRLLDWVRDLIDDIGTINTVITAVAIASAVNGFTFTNAIASGVPKISVTGSDSNISARYATKGTGEHIWEVNGADELRLSAGALYPYTDGGLDLGGASNCFGAAYLSSGLSVLGTTTASITIRTTGSNNPELRIYDTTDGGFTWFNFDGVTYLGRLNTSGSWTENLISISTTDVVSILGTTSSTSTTTGALTVAGGVGVAGNIYAGGVGSFVGGAVIISDGNGAISLGGVNKFPYLDFNSYNGTLNDYDVRIQVGGGQNGVSGRGSLWITAGTLSLITASGTNVLFGPWSSDTSYNAISLNNNVDGANFLGLLGKGGGDPNLYYFALTGGMHVWRVNNITIAQLSSTQLYVAANTATTSTTTGAIRAVGGISSADVICAPVFRTASGNAVGESGSYTRFQSSDGGAYWDLGRADQDYAVLRTDGNINFANHADVSQLSIQTTGTAGVTVGSPAGGFKGAGTINAVAVYDDDILLTCFGVEYLKYGTIDLKTWDGFAPGGRHGLAHEFVALTKSFDPCDRHQYIAKMMHDEALPGMPSKTDWRHNTLSVGQMTNRLWLAAELQAGAIKHLSDDVDHLSDRERKLTAELSAAQKRITQLESRSIH